MLTWNFSFYRYRQVFHCWTLDLQYQIFFLVKIKFQNSFSLNFDSLKTWPWILLFRWIAWSREKIQILLDGTNLEKLVLYFRNVLCTYKVNVQLFCVFKKPILLLIEWKNCFTLSGTKAKGLFNFSTLFVYQYMNDIDCSTMLAVSGEEEYRQHEGMFFF